VIEEAPVTTHQTKKQSAALQRRQFGQLRCPNCDDMLLAPAASEYVNECEVRHFWSCEECGHEFTTAVGLRIRRVDERHAAAC
jgi:uncharacterized protein with PIN domain